MTRLSWARSAAWRARRQHLDRRAPPGAMLAVASRLCGLHAQVLSSAELSLWARVEAFERQAVARALWEERSLVKTWAMRGTLHLLPARELPLWHAALATSPRYLRPSVWQTNFGLSIADLDRLTGAITAALAGGALTREELAREVGRRTSHAMGEKLAASSWGTVLKPAAFAGGLCFAASVGQRVRFTHPHTWLADSGHALAPRPAAEEATAEVTRRYLAAYGPAAAHDLARWWNGGGVTAARRWIAALGRDVSEVEVDGTPAWMLAGDAREARDLPPPRSARLLPAFDPYVVGASWHAERLLPGGLRGRVYRPQGWISPVLLVDGRMLGTWRHNLAGSRVVVAIQPFVKLPAWARRAAGEEAERLAAFLGGTLCLTWQ